jgi:hypothetical protein
VIGIEELDALDLMLWLGSGSEAARQLDCNQSTVSRRCNHCLKVFDLRLHRDGEGWTRTRRHDLLELEREVHQLYRFRRGRRLRLDASLLAAPLLEAGAPAGWITGSLDALGWQRPVQLLEERILDAWITAMGQELQAVATPALVCIPLLFTPLQLAATANHPLLGQGDLSLNDVAGQPRLAPRLGVYPRTEQLLGSWRERHRPLPLSTTPRRGGRSNTATAEPVLHYGTRFSLAHQLGLHALPLELGVRTELSLVVRSDISEQGALQTLLQTLQQRARQAVLADLGLPAHC